MDFPTFTDLFQRGRNEILSRQGLLSRESVEREGSDANVLVAGGGAMADLVMLVVIRMFNAMFFSTASGSDLDRLALDRYGLVRKPAASALGSVVFSGTAPVTDVVIPAGTQLATSSGVAFQTTAAGVWAAGATSTPQIPVASSLAGANQQAGIGTITVIVTPIAGAPNSTTVTNTFATAGAADSESDIDFRARCIAFPQTLLQGTVAAIEQAAESVPGVETANAIESLDSNGQQDGSVQLVIADAYTDQLAELNVNPPAYQVQSQQLAAQVVAALGNARAAGIYVNVVVAEVVLVSVQLSLLFAATDSSGRPLDVVATALAASIAALNVINSYPPGTTFNPADVNAVILTVPGILPGSQVVTPSGPVVPTSLQVIRTSLGLVSAATSSGSILSS